MANVMLAFRKTTTDVLTTVSSASSAITHGATAVSDLAAVAALHSSNYRDDTEETLRLNADKRRALRLDSMHMDIARSRIAINRELQADPELAAAYEEVRTSHLAHTQNLSVAAE